MTDHQPEPTPDPKSRETNASEDISSDVVEGLDEVTELTDEVAAQVGNEKEPTDTPLLADPVAVDAVFDDAQKWANRTEEILGGEESPQSETAADVHHSEESPAGDSAEPPQIENPDGTVSGSAPNQPSDDAPNSAADAQDACDHTETGAPASPSEETEADVFATPATTETKTAEAGDSEANGEAPTKEHGTHSAAVDARKDAPVPEAETMTEAQSEAADQGSVADSSRQPDEGNQDVSEEKRSTIPDIGDEGNVEGDSRNDDVRGHCALPDPIPKPEFEKKETPDEGRWRKLLARTVQWLERVDRPFAFLSYRVKKIIGWAALAIVAGAILLFASTFFDLSRIPEQSYDQVQSQKLARTPGR
jgi:hypothetical protein